MSRNFYKLPAIVLVFLVVLPALAAEGRTPIWGPPGAPIVIASDGRYVVTRNITGPGVLPAIDIAAANVDLDLNGFTVGNGNGPSPVITITGPAVEVRIRNGTLTGGGWSILRSVGFGTARKVIIEDIKSQDAQGPAIELNTIETVVIRRSNIIDCTSTGIFLPGQLFKHGTIADNTLKRTGKEAIFLDKAAAFDVVRNQIEIAGNGVFGQGILVENSVGCLIAENLISDAAADGILLRNSQGNKLYNNVVRHAFVSCINLDQTSHDNHIRNNIGTDCGYDFPPGHGLRIQSERNQIEGNTFNINQACGILFDGTSSRNVFGRNMARGNDGNYTTGACNATGLCSGILFPPDSCDVPGPAASNNTALENMIPGPPPF